LDEQKAGPCHDCGGKFPPCVMDFDHVRGVKHRSVSLMRLNAFAAILAEIAKCDLVCANCHRIRTYDRKTSNHMGNCVAKPQGRGRRVALKITAPGEKEEEF
jgi:hypothetical protein